MIDFLITLGAVAQTEARFGPDYGYELPSSQAAQPDSVEPTRGKSWLLPKLPFNDSQDCLTFLVRQIEGFGLLRITHRCPEGTGQVAPWRSL